MLQLRLSERRKLEAKGVGDVDQLVVVGSRKNGGMKACVRGLIGFVMTVLGHLRHRQVKFLQGRALRHRHALGCQTSAGRLDFAHGFEQVVDPVAADVRHDDAAIGHTLRESATDENQKGLSNRCAGNAEAIGQGDLVELGAGLQLALNDLDLELVGDDGAMEPLGRNCLGGGHVGHENPRILTGRGLVVRFQQFPGTGARGKAFESRLLHLEAKADPGGGSVVRMAGALYH